MFRRRSRGSDAADPLNPPSRIYGPIIRSNCQNSRTLDQIKFPFQSMFRRRSRGSAAADPLNPRPEQTPRRIYGPRNLPDERPSKKAIDQTESELFAMIQSYYGRVQIVGVFDAGFCFGLLDPVSNIIVNTVISMALPRDDPDCKARVETELIGDMNQRSLNGLVAFLTCLFPYLRDEEALCFLHVADADPLVAARVIVKDRGMEKAFGFASVTTVAAFETALRCAAAAAQHPNPQQFVLGWKLLSPRLVSVVSLLSDTAQQSIDDISRLLHEEPRSTVFNLEESWDFASSRFVSPNRGVVFPGRAVMRRMLLNTIHGFYLQALARLPKDKLRFRYHRSMLTAGHCYGPLDPVSNIILNTIWYDAAYPASKEFETDMISTTSLLRIAVRSFYGLVSFLCTRYDRLTPDLAMRRLQMAGACLRIADPNLDVLPDAMMKDNKKSWRFHRRSCTRIRADDVRYVVGNSPSASVKEAYAAAAAAAYHPDPGLQQEILIFGPSDRLLPAVSRVLQDGRQLSSDDVQLLSWLLPNFSSVVRSHRQQQPVSNVLKKSVYACHVGRRNQFWRQHARVLTMVRSALDIYNMQDGVSKYELHVICGVNEDVSGPEYIRGGHKRDTHRRTPYIYHYSHINFLATCKDSQAAPMLFFAECCNNGSKEGVLCCPVNVPPPDAEQVRCLYCERQGTRILHPAMEGFHGHGIEFEKVLCGEPPYGFECYTNYDLILHSNGVTYWVDGLEDDSIYTIDYVVDDEEEEDPVHEFFDNLEF